MKRNLSLFCVLLLSNIMTMAQELVVVDGIQYVVNLSDNVSYVLGPEDKSVTSVNVADGVVYNNVTYSVVGLLNNSFNGCNNLTTVNIPSSVISIGEHCFEGCSKMKSISIPNSVHSLPNYCFASCTSLSDVNIPISIKYIGDGCFINCSSLSEISLPNNLVFLGNYVFERCTKLQSISIPKTVESIGAGCFAECSMLESVNIPESITIINSNCFSGCKLLKSICLPPFLTKIGDSAFARCESLASIVFSNILEEIGEWAFSYCTSIKTIEIPASVISTGSFCFLSCNSLTNAIIHSSAEMQGTFGWCEKLYKVVCDANTVPIISKSCSPQAFDGTQFNTIGYLYVPSNLIESYKSDEYWSQWVNIVSINGSDVEDDKYKCATPTISYTNGKLTFNSATEGAVCKYTINDADIKSSEGNEVELNGTYNISVYATKDGYEDSDMATAILTWSDSGLKVDNMTVESTKNNKGDVNGDGVVDVSDYIGVANLILFGTIDGSQQQSRISRHGYME